MTSLLLALISSSVWTKHTFVYESSKDVTSVSVAGTFNNWNSVADPMERVPGTNQWQKTKDLAPGIYQYKFVLNGSQWIQDPKSERDVDDGSGNVNSVLNLLPAELKKLASRTDDMITESELLHTFEHPYVSYDKGRLQLSLRARKGDLSSVGVSYNGLFPTPMVVSQTEDIHEWFTVSLPYKKGAPLHYFFELTSGKTTKLFGADGLDKPKAFELSDSLVKPVRVAKWAEGTVFYHIFPDRFANGATANDPTNVVAWDATPTYANFFGGDVSGISLHIPYLKALGVGALFLNPIFVSPSNHRYETIDYFKLDPRFGTNDEFKRLVAKLKKNGVRTVLDGVFNHTATSFAPFADIVKNGEGSKYLDWYTIKSFPVRVGDPPNYEAWFGFPSMPKVNYESTAAKEFMLSVPKFWFKEAGIDGWRLDVANEVPMSYWQEFRRVVKGLSEDQWIVGESWGDSRQWLKGDQWDSVMGYQFRDAVLKFVADGVTKPSGYFDALMKVHDSYHPAVSRNLMILLGSHDTPRILTRCGGDERKARLAATLQLTWVGSPSIYYGDEIGMSGERDPANRRGMEWSKTTGPNQTLAHYKALIKARNSSPALKSGEPALLLAVDESGALVYQRALGNDRAIVVVNNSNTLQSITFELASPVTKTLVDVFSGIRITPTSKTASVKLEAYGSAVFIGR